MAYPTGRRNRTRTGRRPTRLALLATAAIFLAACGSSGPAGTAPVTSPSSFDTGLASPSASQDVLSETASHEPTPTASPTDTPETETPTPTATRPPLSQRTVTIAAAGDIACDPSANTGAPNDCDQAATAALIGQLHPTAVLTLGDNQYEKGTLAAFQTVYGTTWGQYKRITYPTIGNHEYLTSGAKGYFGYFGFPAYYSFNLGDWHIVSLDSECSYVGGCQAGSVQEKWLLADLAANTRPCTLVTYHEPRWSSGQHGDATQMKTIWADLVAAHVDVVLSGHNHDYERFEPLDANGNPDPTGTTEFVAGTGGKNDYAFSHPPLTGEVTRAQDIFGVLSLTLRPTSFSWRFVDAPGFSFADSGSASCH